MNILNLTEPTVLGDHVVSGDSEAWLYSEALQIATACPNSLSSKNTGIRTPQLRAGYELVYRLPQATPMILGLNVHDSQSAALVVPDEMTVYPPVPITPFRDVWEPLPSPGGANRPASHRY